MNKITHIDRKWYLLFLFIISINLNACKKENITHKSNPNINKEVEDYKEAEIKKIKIDEDKSKIIYELRSPNLDKIILDLDLNNETADLKIKDKKITTDFNFTYDITLEDAVNRIKLLTNIKGDLVFLMPVATEEYLTFEILKYEKKSNSFLSSNFHFETHQDILKLYLNSTPKLEERDSQYFLNIGSYKFAGNFQLKNVTNTKPTTDFFDFKGFYTICTPNSIKTETCYEITIKSDSAFVDANTSICKGDYKLSQVKSDEINLIHEIDSDCAIKIKKTDQNFLIQLPQSDNFIPIKKEK
ncbi:hypothetical protein [Chryseobacterium joostei]|uniref:hypothetical protein n=1 Tax=Chryseobacterium joostei TaxID=112234 RepID=UPI003D11E280